MISEVPLRYSPISSDHIQPSHRLQASIPVPPRLSMVSATLKTQKACLATTKTEDEEDETFGDQEEERRGEGGFCACSFGRRDDRLGLV